LGVDIKLDYTFPQPAPAASEPTEVNGGQVTDSAVEPGTADCSGANERDAQAAKELMISARPAIPQRRPAEAGARKLNKAARNDKR
jgi:hypothetical protein